MKILLSDIEWDNEDDFHCCYNRPDYYVLNCDSVEDVGQELFYRFGTYPLNYKIQVLDSDK